MKIIEKLKDIKTGLHSRGNLTLEDANFMYCSTLEALKEVERLQADRLEMARAIVDNCIYDAYGLADYCIHCESSNKHIPEIKHKSDCIVLKAEKIIGETETT